MKKAKVILSAVAIMAVVGGAFAFKATRIPTRLYYPTDAAKRLCTNSSTFLFTTTDVPQPIGLVNYTIAPTTTGCPTYTTTTF
ncbi:hypothetical protein [Chitinophaga sp. CF418]|uniref:hypothetical protein n=1 Tax=Chitinophaga sp. CF418 TaxID=1855287 RepID=UPI000924845A|nr:hypothetical protein [Chitinophaga sp. CF418]SHN45806.1 hypothetical protein SAMN05216311_121108 [Chitinophaga sp. CF418]